MVLIKWLLIVIALAVLAAVLAGQFGLFRGDKPDDLGVHDDKLKPPSSTPNSVTSQAALYPDHPQQSYASIPPLTVHGDGESTLTLIKNIVETTAGAEIIESRADYLYAQFTTPIMKFVDDTEFWYEPTQDLIHVRSASRLGKSDLGTNRKRIETIRKQLNTLADNS
jgi:uncharacterized protein (DUF1499 family)